MISILMMSYLNKCKKSLHAYKYKSSIEFRGLSKVAEQMRTHLTVRICILMCTVHIVKNNYLQH